MTPENIIRVRVGESVRLTPRQNQRVNEALSEVAQVTGAAVVATGLAPGAGAEPEEGSLEWALEFARTYWMHGCEPKAQLALTVLARQVNDQ